MKRTILALAMVLLLSATGAGCFLFKQQKDTSSAGPKPADLVDVSAEEASRRINFVKGSQIEIRQTRTGANGKDVGSDPENDKTGIRIITIERFAPFYVAALNWKLAQNLPTQESLEQLAVYEERLQNLDEGEQPPEKPEIITERRTVVGKLKDINLKSTHKLFLPAYWPTDEATVKELSAIWVSRDVFEEIKGTKNSTIYYGILDNALFGAMYGAKNFALAIEALNGDVAAIVDKIDVNLTESQDPDTLQLMVNGQEIEVQVIKVSNWYGEIVVLDNPQNPLILKMTLSLQGKENLKNSGQADFLQSLIGYEVTQLNGVQ